MKKILFSIFSALLLTSGTVNAVRNETAVGIGLAAGVATGAAVRQVLLRKWSREIDAAHYADWSNHNVYSGGAHNNDISNAKVLSTVLGLAAGIATASFVTTIATMDDNS